MIAPYLAVDFTTSFLGAASKELCTAPRGRRLAQTGGAKDVLVRSFVLSVLARLEDRGGRTSDEWQDTWLS